MQKKYLYLTLAIFLVVICTIAVSNTFANTNALTKVQVTSGTVGPNTYHASDTVEWNIQVHSWLGATNASPNKMTNLTIIDVLPAGETFVTGSNTSTGSPTFTVTNNGTYNQILKWDYGTANFQADPEVQVTYNVTLYSNLPDGTFLTNTANWSALVQDPYSLNWNPQSATGSDSISVVASPSNISTSFNTTSPITMGTSFQDDAILGGFVFNYSMAFGNANVTFYWSTNDATWNLLCTVPAPANGGQVNSTTITGLSAGTYYFKANYTGNSYYKANESVNASEIMVINPTSSQITTTLNNTSITLGGTVHDTANVTFPVSIPPYPVPTGTVTFSVQLTNGTWVPLGTVSTVWDNNTKQYYAVSADFTPLGAGTYYFNCTYSGDSNYNGSYHSSDYTNEILHVAPFTPTVTTLLNATTITLGQSVTDAAIVTGLGGSFPMPTGTVTFGVEWPNGTWTTYDGTPSLNASGKATSGAFTPTQTGTYYFNVTYNGDGNYTGSTSSTTLENVTVTKATPTVTTTLYLFLDPPITSIILGQGVYDTATVAGLGGSFPVPTGTVTFSVQLPNGTTVTFDTNEPLVAGVATSATYYPLTTGTYHFKATYNGDGNYTVASSILANEPLTVNATTSQTCTTLNATSITLGGTVHDTANVTFPVSIPPYPVPTGTVTFQVQLTNGTWVPLGTVSTVWDNNTKQYYAVSADFTPSGAGTYHFNATYSGDSNYSGSTLSQLESLTVTKPTPTVTTLLNASTITLGQSITDKANVTGLGGSFPVPTGTVNFEYWNTTSWVSFDNETLVNGMATSTVFTPVANGEIQVVYSGDGNYTSAMSDWHTEEFNVLPTYSNITTTLNATSITIGSTIHDTANVTFPVSIPPYPVPTGTVTFQVQLTNGTWVPLGTVSTVWDNNTKQYYAVSADFTPSGAGTYHFNATYSGDSNYSGSTLSVLESLVVGKANTTVTTILNATSITLGSGVYDNATVTGSAGTPTGFVLFQCNATGTWVTFANVTLNNGVASFANYTPMYAGTFFFQAVYSGDGSYIGSTSALENVTVGKAPSTTHTYLNATTIVLGGTVHDTANVTFPVSIPPYPVPTGTVTFSVQLTNGTWVPLGTASLAWNAVTQQLYAVSSDFTPLSAGIYYFNATYSGDGNYTGSNEPGNVDHPNEKLVVTPATPLVQTTLNATSIILGQNITDKVIVWGLPNPPFPTPTGNVTFQYNGNGTWLFYDNETLVNGVVTSAPFTPPYAGIFYFRAIYSGDGNYTQTNSYIWAEQLVVNLPTPTITTTLSNTPIIVGSTIYDNATVTGYGSLSLAGGFVQFWYMAPGGQWTAFPGSAQQVTNATGGTFTSGYLSPIPNVIGNWYIKANYTGNNNYLPGTSANELLQVQLATPCVSTNLSAVSITLGTSIYDNATVTGYTQLPVPTGTVTFQYNINSSWVTYDTETLVNGMATSIPFTPTQTGTYYFLALYSGDTNYNSNASGLYEEFLIVNVNPTTIVFTTLNATTITLGNSTYDSATVIGPNSTTPTGTVQFYWELGGGSWTTYGSPVNLTSGVAQSPTFQPNATGTYYFMAAYSGDSSHNAANSTMPEVLTVSQGTLILQTFVNGVSTNQTITLGQTAFDKAIAWGLPNPPYPVPTGTVQFYWELSGGSWSPLGSPVTLVYGVATSPTIQPNQTGTYYFMATYSGDSNYNVANNNATEALTVNPSTPAVETWLTSPSITLGQSVSDQAIVWGLPLPPFPATTGTVQFYWELSGGTWSPLGSPVTLVYGVAVSPTFQPNATGTYYFKAVYSGDTNYNTASSSVEEVLTVGPVGPGVQTILNATSIAVNQSVTDQAIIWGLPLPPFPATTGTVQFYWELSGGNWTALGSPVTLVYGVAVSPTFIANQTGTYYFMAAYSGDINYLPNNSSVEVLTVGSGT